MGFGGISVWQLLIVLGIALLVFGTSRLKTLGTDLGGAIKGFRRAMEHEDAGATSARPAASAAPRLAGQTADGVAAEHTEAEKQA